MYNKSSDDAQLRVRIFNCFGSTFRWEILQVLHLSWQQYASEEARLNEWLTAKELEIEQMKGIDASNVENIRETIKQLQVGLSICLHILGWFCQSLI